MKKYRFVLIGLIFWGITSIAIADSNINQNNQGSVPVNNITAVGDLNFDEPLGSYIIKNPDYPWLDLKELLTNSTILVGNLEVPISQHGLVYTKKTWILHADPRTVQALVSGGFDVVTLANNHMMDYGPVSLQETLDTLDINKIAHTGAGMNRDEARKPAILVTPDGTKIAFLAYSLTYPEIFWANSNRPGTVYGDPCYFIPDIKNAKSLADFVVVSFHWSDELHYYPSPYQITYAHQCIEAGASIVLGHHPHVLQGLEIYKGGLIAYSLGNFAFSSYSAKCKDSVLLKVDFDRNGLIQARIYPVNVNNYEVEFQTKLRHGTDAQRVLQDLRTYSGSFKTEIKSENEVGVIKIRN